MLEFCRVCGMFFLYILSRRGINIMKCSILYAIAVALGTLLYLLPMGNILALHLSKSEKFRKTFSQRGDNDNDLLLGGAPSGLTFFVFVIFFVSSSLSHILSIFLFILLFSSLTFFSAVWSRAMRYLFKPPQ